MQLTATGPHPVAYAYGAYQHGSVLRCGLLFVQRGNPEPVVTLQCPDTKQEFRVRLPKEAVNSSKHLRFSREELEIL